MWRKSRRYKSLYAIPGELSEHLHGSYLDDIIWDNVGKARASWNASKTRAEHPAWIFISRDCVDVKMLSRRNIKSVETSGERKQRVIIARLRIYNREQLGLFHFRPMRRFRKPDDDTRTVICAHGNEFVLDDAASRSRTRTRGNPKLLSYFSTSAQCNFQMKTIPESYSYKITLSNYSYKSCTIVAYEGTCPGKSHLFLRHRVLRKPGCI